MPLLLVDSFRDTALVERTQTPRKRLPDGKPLSRLHRLELKQGVWELAGKCNANAFSLTLIYHSFLI